MLVVFWIAHKILITKARLLKINTFFFTLVFPYTASTYNLNIKLSHFRIYKYTNLYK